MPLCLLSTWSIFWYGSVKGIILRLSYHQHIFAGAAMKLIDYSAGSPIMKTTSKKIGYTETKVLLEFEPKLANLKLESRIRDVNFEH